MSRKNATLRTLSLLACSTTLATAPQCGDAQQPSVLRLWGVATRAPAASPLLNVLTKLEDEYKKVHPEVTFSHPPGGNDSALGALYVGAADLVFMDREPSYIELDGYQQVITGQKPFEAPLMRGGIATPGHSSPLVIVVNRKNPIAAFAHAQLRALFLAAPSSTVQPIRTWADLAVGGAYTNKPVSLYGFPIASDEAQTFIAAAMDGNQRWACGYQEANGSTSLQQAKQVVESVERDPFAIGLTTLDAVDSAVRIVPIRAAGGPALLPTPEALSSGEYLLGRTVIALARASHDNQVEPKARDFLDFLLTPRAHAIIAADGEYLPLSEKSPTRRQEVRP